MAILAGLLIGSAQLTAASEDESQLSVTHTTLEKVQGCPEAFTKMPFEVDLLFRALGDIYNPFYTLFEPSTHLNFSAWSINTPVWTREGYMDHHPLFYVSRKTKENEHTLLNMKPYTWFRARCIVRSTMTGRSWIEVIKVVDQDGQLHSQDLKHLARGWMHVEQGSLQPALAEFDAVKYQNLPGEFAALCKTEQADYALRMGNPQQAMLTLRMARSFSGSDNTMARISDLSDQAQSMALKQHEQTNVAAVETATDEEPSLEEWPDPESDTSTDPATVDDVSAPMSTETTPNLFETTPVEPVEIIETAPESFPEEFATDPYVPAGASGTTSQAAMPTSEAPMLTEAEQGEIVPAPEEVVLWESPEDQGSDDEMAQADSDASLQSEAEQDEMQDGDETTLSEVEGAPQADEQVDEQVDPQDSEQADENSTEPDAWQNDESMPDEAPTSSQDGSQDDPQDDDLPSVPDDASASSQDEPAAPQDESAEMTPESGSDSEQTQDLPGSREEVPPVLDRSPPADWTPAEGEDEAQDARADWQEYNGKVDWTPATPPAEGDAGSESSTEDLEAPKSDGDSPTEKPAEPTPSPEDDGSTS